METQIKEKFVELFGETPQGVFRAPGRVNLIGEHTDYNDGFVLPAAIDFFTWVAASTRTDNIIEAIALDELDSQGQPSKAIFNIDSAPTKQAQAPWSDYLLGVICELRESGFCPGGAKLLIKGNVPRGAGLSSSASLENALVLALTTLSNETIDGAAAARVGQAAENNYAGCQCGIMDQMASALGQENAALLLDCRSLKTKIIPFPQGAALVVINSKVKRGLVDSEYNTRRKQCEEAAAFFDAKALRDVSLDQLETNKNTLDDHVYRRARHVITENQRTLDASEALAAGDLLKLSALMHSSHESMKNDFEITVPAIDSLVDIVRAVVGELGGVRMTGGGFGGCVIALIPDTLTKPLVEQVNKIYPALSGLQPEIFICKTTNGAFVRNHTGAHAPASC